MSYVMCLVIIVIVLWMAKEEAISLFVSAVAVVIFPAAVIRIITRMRTFRVYNKRRPKALHLKARYRLMRSNLTRIKLSNG